MELMHYLTLSAILFSIGFYGLLTRRNAININLVAFNRFVSPNAYVGQIFAIFVIVVAAAEATVGLAIVILIYRNWRSIDADRVNLLKW
jgi:NAD(P)H-quinone oxidoreductase subunit 4L